MAAPGEREYGPFRQEEREDYLRILNRCFHVSDGMDHTVAWFGTVDADELRTLRIGGRPVATLVILPMGQFFGGRSVPTAGLAGVGVDPDARGCGAARTLLQGFLREARGRGFPLSTLYPSTYTLYRAMGYERAGGRWELEVAPDRLVGLGGQGVETRPARAEDEPLLRELWGRWGSAHPGQLDRGEYVWGRVTAPRGVETHAVVLQQGGEAQGYVRWLQEASRDDPYELVLTDHVALTPESAAAALTFLAGHRSMVQRARWTSGPGDPLLQLLPERRFELRLLDEWMLRVLDVRAALEGRGWPQGLTARIELELEDELCPENAGRWVLSVAEGRARVERGGAGRIALGPRGLAALYSGFRSAGQLALAGALRGDPADLPVADAAFAGPSPWMADMF